MVERVENLVTINGTVNGAFMPASKNRLLTDVMLKDGFHIRGGLYANNLTIEGSGTVEGPVMAKRDILIMPPEDINKRISLRCGLSAKLAIVCQVRDTFTPSPVNTKGFMPLFVRGDVISESVALENAVVIGNIFAANATVKDSIIVGCPFIENKLVLRNSMVISFRAGDVVLIGRNSVWVPYGLAQGDIQFAEYRPDAEENAYTTEYAAEGPARTDDSDKAWLRYLGLCRTKEHGCDKEHLWFRCDKHRNGTCEKEEVRMTEKDIVLVKRGDKKFKAITVAPRFINLQKVEKQLREMVDLLTDALYFEHFHSSSQEQVRTELKEIFQKERGKSRPHYEFLDEVVKHGALPEKGARS